MVTALTELKKMCSQVASFVYYKDEQGQTVNAESQSKPTRPSRCIDGDTRRLSSQSRIPNGVRPRQTQESKATGARCWSGEDIQKD